MIDDYDIAIVGAGVTGLVTALAFAQSTSLRLLVLESQREPSPWDPLSSQNRYSALSWASQQIFLRLGIWGQVAKNASAFQKMHVWCSSGSGQVDFTADSMHLPALGYIVANRLLEMELTRALQNEDRVRVIYSMTPSALTFHADHVAIQSTIDELFFARLVVGADGARSKMRELAGLSQTEQDYGQIALVAKVETMHPHANEAAQIFLPTGPLAFLPLASPKCSSIVWSTTPAEAIRLQALSDDEFASALTDAFQARLGKVMKVSGRNAFSLVKRHANQYVRDRFALVGDAAHTIHPLAGQGLNLGLQDVVCLVETVAEAKKQGRQFAAIHTLRRYERARKTMNSTMLMAMDFFQQVSAHPNRIVQAIWQTGMLGVNQLPFVKHALIATASGR